MNLKWAMLLPVFMLLAGCSEQYRYPCQDPENWGEKQCKKPYCSANGTCPEDLTPYEKDKVGQIPGNTSLVQPAPQAPKKGECK
jgi:hypothetical protein